MRSLSLSGFAGSVPERELFESWRFSNRAEDEFAHGDGNGPESKFVFAVNFCSAVRLQSEVGSVCVRKFSLSERIDSCVSPLTTAEEGSVPVNWFASKMKIVELVNAAKSD